MNKFIFGSLAALSIAGYPVEPAAQNNPATRPDQTEIQSRNLDELFSRLKKERHPRVAERLSEQIWLQWHRSGSESIDLLSAWARKAIAEEKFSVALDLLDQVTTLRPGFAEGWNQRATLHYMMKNYDKSLYDVERVLALEPRHFGALSGLGLILQAYDRKKQALEAWYRVLALYPAMKSAQKAVISLEEEIAAKRI